MSKLSSVRLRDFQEFACDSARAAGLYMKAYEHRPFTPDSSAKFINEYVANKIENLVRERVRSAYPTHGLFGSNTLPTDSDYEWICDYIDGAYSYSLGYKISVTSIALTHKGESVVCAVYNPWTDQLYSAIKGHGSYLGSTKLRPPKITLREGTLIDVEWWPWAIYDIDTWLHKVSLETHSYVLHVGSVIHAACLVAEGVFGAAALAKYMKGKNHEIAAAKLLVEESGCKITDLLGNSLEGLPSEVHGLLIANAGCYQTLLDSYKKYREENEQN